MLGRGSCKFLLSGCQPSTPVLKNAKLKVTPIELALGNHIACTCSPAVATSVRFEKLGWRGGMHIASSQIFGC